MLFDGSQGVARELLQLPPRQIFLAELNVVHSCARCFGNFLQKTLPLCGFISGELLAVGNVVKKHPEPE